MLGCQECTLLSFKCILAHVLLMQKLEVLWSVLLRLGFGKAILIYVTDYTTIVLDIIEIKVGGAIL